MQLSQIRPQNHHLQSSLAQEIDFFDQATNLDLQFDFDNARVAHLEDLSQKIESAVSHFNQADETTRANLSSESLVTFIKAYKGLVLDKIPTQIRNAKRFIDPNVPARLISYEKIFLYLNVAMKLFKELDDTTQDNLSYLSKMLERNDTAEKVNSLMGPNKILWIKLKEVFSYPSVTSHHDNMREKILSALDSLKSHLTPHEHVEYDPCGPYGRFIYQTLFRKFLGEYLLLREEIINGYYLYPDSIQLARDVMTRIGDEITDALKNILTLNTLKTELHFSIMKTYIFFALAYVLLNELEDHQQQLIQEILRKIPETSINDIVHSSPAIPNRYKGLYVCVIETISPLLGKLNRFSFTSFVSKFNQEIDRKRQNASLDDGWVEPHSSGAKNNLSEQKEKDFLSASVLSGDEHDLSALERDWVKPHSSGAKNNLSTQNEEAKGETSALSESDSDLEQDWVEA